MKKKKKFLRWKKCAKRKALAVIGRVNTGKQNFRSTNLAGYLKKSPKFYFFIAIGGKLNTT